MGDGPVPAAARAAAASTRNPGRAVEQRAARRSARVLRRRRGRHRLRAGASARSCVKTPPGFDAVRRGDGRARGARRRRACGRRAARAHRADRAHRAGDDRADPAAPRRRAQPGRGLSAAPGPAAHETTTKTPVRVAREEREAALVRHERAEAEAALARAEAVARAPVAAVRSVRTVRKARHPQPRLIALQRHEQAARGIEPPPTCPLSRTTRAPVTRRRSARIVSGASDSSCTTFDSSRRGCRSTGSR